jgi:CRP-like cAMP-binding protein
MTVGKVKIFNGFCTVFNYFSQPGHSLLCSNHTQQLQAFLKYLNHNAGVLPEHIEQIGGHCITQSVSKGDLLLKAGEVSRYTWFVEKGLLRFYQLGSDGKEHLIQFAPENWFVSERNSYCFNEPSEYYIDAYEDSELVLLNQQFMQIASGISAEFRAYNERILQTHIRQLQRRISLLIGATAEERYLDFIRVYPDLTQRLPQRMIASYLGITPESLSRVRKELMRKS